MQTRTWTIPETKNGEPHVVPLSHQAVDLLRSQLPPDIHGKLTQPQTGPLIFTTSTGGAVKQLGQGDEGDYGDERHRGLDTA